MATGKEGRDMSDDIFEKYQAMWDADRAAAKERTNSNLRTRLEKQFNCKIVAMYQPWTEDGVGVDLFVLEKDFDRIWEESMWYNTGGWPGYTVKVADKYWDDATWDRVGWNGNPGNNWQGGEQQAQFIYR
jgi:hypothetical protein